jgi:putative transposase
VSIIHAQAINLSKSDPTRKPAGGLFWVLLASGQIAMRKVDGSQTLATKPTDAVIDLAA